MTAPPGWEWFSDWLLKSSGQAAVLVVLVLVIQWSCRGRLPARWRHVLWWIVIVRLLVPLFVPGPVSVFNWVRWPDANSTPDSRAELVKTALPTPEVEVGARPLETSAVPAGGLATATPLPSPAGNTDTAPNASGSPRVPTVSPTKTGPGGNSSDGLLERRASNSAASGTSWHIVDHWRACILWLWLGGVMLCSARLGWGAWRLGRELRRASRVINSETLELLDCCRRQMGVRRKVSLLETPMVSSPALCGYWKPQLLFPPGLLENFTLQELRFVFLHELAHVRRGDILVNWLTAVLQVAHWFNPMIWLAFYRLRADRELACDALALSVAEPGEHHAYGLTVIKLLENLTPASALPGVVGILEDRSQMKRRIRMIAGFRPGARWSLLAIALLTILALVGLTDAQVSGPARDSGAKSSSATNSSATASGAVAGTNLVVTLVGEDPWPSAATNLPIRRLTVTVLGTNGVPLPGAEVSFPYIGNRNEPRPKRVTDAAGKFVARFPEIPKEFRRTMANFSVNARHPDYSSRTVMWTSAGGDVYAGLPEQVTIRLQPGMSVGGVVQNEQGEPLVDVRVLLTGSGYQGYTMGNSQRLTHEYPELWGDDSQGVRTDAGGRWQFKQFPTDLRKVDLTFIRPGDAREVFSTEGNNGLNQRPTISLLELKEGKLVTRLRDGFTVRGIVVDENGKPLAGVTIKEGYGHGNIVRVSEITTGADGRFERPHRAARQWLYTASRSDRTTATVVAQVEAAMGELRLVLLAAKPWRGRVIDETGAPLSDVDFRIDSYRTEAQILDWSGTTDADGRVIWTNAPGQEVTMYANARKLGINRKIKVRGGETEQAIVLNKKSVEQIELRLRAMDSVTKGPVKVSRLSMRFDGGGSPFRLKAEPQTNDFPVTVERTDFRVGMYPAFEMRLEADGYETLLMKPIDYDLGDHTVEAMMVRMGGPSRLTILKPDGAPADGARLWAGAASGDGPLYSNQKGRFSGDRLLKSQADDDGGADVPGIASTGWVIFTHPDGYLELNKADLPADGIVKLREYGAVEGWLLVAGEPKPGVNMSLAPLAWSPSIRSHVSYTATPGPDGRFSFTGVPPGQYKLYRWALPKRRDTSGQTITETYQHPVSVVAGQTTEVEYYAPGRRIIGQAVTSPANLAVNWSWDVHTLALKLPEVKSGGVNREDYVTFEAFQKANTESHAARGRLDQAGRVRTYPLQFEVDGTFQIDDVPPGLYELRIGVTKPGESSRRNPFGRQDEIGSLVREVTVSAGPEPLDLGLLTVPVEAAMIESAEVTKSAGPAASMEARTLSGKKFSLSELAGRNVLLVFWASWSERSVSQWMELEKLINQAGAGSRLAMLGVSLDETLEAARQTVTRHRWKGTQVWVDAEGRARLASTFDVNTLPSIFLLDGEHRILARELEADRLPDIMKRVMAKK